MSAFSRSHRYANLNADRLRLGGCNAARRATHFINVAAAQVISHSATVSTTTTKEHDMSTTMLSANPAYRGAFLVAAAAAIASAPIAAAEPALPTAGGESASATLSDLQSQGYNVAVNYLQGRPNVPLSECRVNAINNPSAPTAPPSTNSTLPSLLPGGTPR